MSEDPVFYYSDKAILKLIGAFVKQKRIDQGLKQEELAEKAAMSRSTLSLMERGENIALLNLIKILRILDAVYIFDQFKLPMQISPFMLAMEDAQKRKKVYSTKAKSTKPDSLW